MRQITRNKLSALLAVAAVAAFFLAPSARAAGLEAENLLLTMPPGFVVGDEGRSGPKTDMAEYVLQGESVNDWSKMITVEIMHDVANGDAGGFAGRLAAAWSASCPGGDAGKLGAGDVNGYPYELWGYRCPLNPATGKPENMWMKAVAGADAFYAVQYAYRQALDGDLAAPATDFLGKVSVCDSRKAAQACPAGM